MAGFLNPSFLDCQVAQPKCGMLTALLNAAKVGLKLWACLQELKGFTTDLYGRVEGFARIRLGALSSYILPIGSIVILFGITL